MAVAGMQFVSIMGHLPDFDQFVRECVINRQFHPEKASDVMRHSRILFSLDQENPYSDLLAHFDEASADTGIALEFSPFGQGSPNTAAIEEYLNKFKESYSELKNERERLELLIKDNKQIILQLEHVREVDAELQDFWTFTYSKFRFGRMPRAVYESFSSHIRDISDLFFFLTSIDHDYAYGMYLTPTTSAEKNDSLFTSLQFERIFIPGKIYGTADESISSLNAEIESCKKALSDIAARLKTLIEAESPVFLKHYSCVRFYNEAFEMRRYAMRSKESFYLTGWVPDEFLSGFTKRLDDYGKVTYVTEDPATVGEDCSPPIKLKNPKIFRPFEAYVSMYGLPSYGEIDPTALMAITYTLLFGIMFGDVGQGVMISLIGFLMWKLRGMWLGRILVYAGISSVGFGFVYNSVFGYEHFLPYEGFKVLEGDNTNTMLMLAVFAGVVLISVAMIINVINGFKQKNFTKCLFSPNGLAGFIFYWALVFAVLPMLGFGESNLTIWYILGFVGLPLMLIFLREPLGKLLSRRPDWKPEGIGGFIVENAFELIEVLLSYVTNTISFLRVGAFALSHAGMMMVVFLLAGSAAGSENIVVVIFGNILVTGIEALLVGIQVLRLEFYELFGRFYSGDGKPYSPIVIESHGQDRK